MYEPGVEINRQSTDTLFISTDKEFNDDNNLHACEACKFILNIIEPIRQFSLKFRKGCPILDKEFPVDFVPSGRFARHGKARDLDHVCVPERHHVFYFLLSTQTSVILPGEPIKRLT